MRTQKRVAGYVRTSTDQQKASGAGLLAQRSAIRQECGRRGWRLVEIFEDAAASGRSLTRTGLRAALDALDTKQVDALVVAKLDRLSRSLLDFSALMERSRRAGWAVVALDLGVDTTTPSGEMMANVLATFAQFERRLIGQRTKEALAEKRAQGVRLGRPRVVSPSVELRIRRMRGHGLSFSQIADKLTRDGVPAGRGGARWYRSTVRGVLVSRDRDGSRAHDAARHTRTAVAT